MKSTTHNFVFSEKSQHLPISSEISRHYFADEAETIQNLKQELLHSAYSTDKISQNAVQLVSRVRDSSQKLAALDAFMQEYDLSSDEGVTLMCLAESLLRIPDKETAELLIRDKLDGANWNSHLGNSPSLFVNASTWGLMLTGKIVDMRDHTAQSNQAILKNLLAKSSEPVIRHALKQSMQIMGHQFVMGKNINAAIKRSLKPKNADYRYSFDMLGEAALTQQDADQYFSSYANAITVIGAKVKGDIHAVASISIKLSALHPRYELTHQKQVLDDLTPKLILLCKQAKDNGIALTIDAEEANRLELSLALLENLLSNSELSGWNGLGLAVQAYQRRALPVLHWLTRQAKKTERIIPVRLVKGAYWDTEIKLAQEQGLESYPVFTRKVNTDFSYLACAAYLLSHRDSFYPQFATHNAHTIAAVMQMAGNNTGFEFQRLHGMGQLLYQQVIPKDRFDVPCRVYAPVGSHEDLLPYLVRRLLENGANTSFVNRIIDEKLSPEEIVSDPVTQVLTLRQIPHPAIPAPAHIFGEQRLNSKGYNLDDYQSLLGLQSQLENLSYPTDALPVSPNIPKSQCSQHPIFSPQDNTQIGEWFEPDSATIKTVIDSTVKAQADWDRMPVAQRADCLDSFADLLEQNSSLFIKLCIEEAGKTLADSVSEIREAVDFCRYYAQQARSNFTHPVVLPGPTGEQNLLSAHGKGVFVCISPWNFPLAIFTGQIVAALVCGNAVIAKPAEQTNLIACTAGQLLIKAGIPEAVFHVIPGFGAKAGAQLCNDPRISGVAFTGSTETARLINRTLAGRDSAIATFVAETGGQNAMLVDSSALPEQVVKDVINSAFGSSGQRCSALRVLFLQEEIAEHVIQLLKGALKVVNPGDPRLFDTDIGPVIDQAAQKSLLDHIAKMEKEARLIGRVNLPEQCNQGHYVAPHIFELKHISQLSKEHFGPILHVIRFPSGGAYEVIDEINNSGYGLTMGIHSRIESQYYDLRSRVKVGNCYINRNMIGAVVGVNPFGGEGLSGTGPKAGGPHYLYRFITERTTTTNTTAIGGNASLLSMDDLQD
ncbi:MAG: bifunctional proline dehydrogenase/L-glutamate gamma-semialdehyde dehydrogenase PutA [bacterium]